MESKESTPVYPSVSRFADGMCYDQYSASLKCLESNSKEKHKCQEHFDVYKECKKKEVLLHFSGSLLRFGCVTFDKLASSIMLTIHWVSEREARLERNKNRSLFS